MMMIIKTIMMGIMISIIMTIVMNIKEKIIMTYRMACIDDAENDIN